MDHTTMSMPMAMGPETTGGAAAGGMGGASSPSAMMAMTFFQALETPLFAAGWTPRSGAAYAATCLFLVALGVVMRSMLALKPLLEAVVWCRPDDEAGDDDDDGEGDGLQQDDCAILVPSGKYEHSHPGTRARHRRHNDGGGGGGRGHPSASRALWTEIRRRGRASRLGPSAGRAAFEVLLAVVGYLLMLAVMTMNLGYFASVLAGVFLGTFVLGDLATSSSLYQDHHC